LLLHVLTTFPLAISPHSRLPTPDSRLPTPDSLLPTPDSRLPTPDSRLPKTKLPHQIDNCY
ncbi:MAG: hypothetical protein F6K37_42080, partial [Moorea sp. SIO4E2]|uniref:hypothetical protein n=1 Tax=Moorena sp. SIO4E2 TaxID=2607826 RepID=UPI0013BC3812